MSFRPRATGLVTTLRFPVMTVATLGVHGLIHFACFFRFKIDLHGWLSLLGLPLFFFFNDTATTEIYTLSLHDALPISASRRGRWASRRSGPTRGRRSAPVHLRCPAK